MMGKAKAQQRLVDNLEDEFGKVGKSLLLLLSIVTLLRVWNKFKNLVEFI